jgi:hypothetical protein
MTNPKKTLALLAGWLGITLAVAPTGFAADASAIGTIEGRVQNVASGAYLEKVRITIEGTSLEALTGSDGFYRIANALAGPARLNAFYTGLPAHAATVTVTGGQATRHDISLAPSGAGDRVVKLSEMVVSSSREMDGAAIAINEQRFAANMMNVVSADEFGTILFRSRRGLSIPRCSRAR